MKCLPLPLDKVVVTHLEEGIKSVIPAYFHLSGPKTKIFFVIVIYFDDDEAVGDSVQVWFVGLVHPRCSVRG